MGEKEIGKDIDFADNMGIIIENPGFLSGYTEEGKTVILASHNKEDIEILCDTVYEMEHGRLV